ncbi:hypothetical protein BT69DRAFT_800972 [Atractiella rhizophila]|nr:hypothetical protein BT69DRAFT_800972 [Atractiella rhizophila]
MTGTTIETDEVDAPYLDFQPLLPNIRLSPSPFSLTISEDQHNDIPHSCHLFALSNDTGYCAWVSREKDGSYSLSLTRLAVLRQQILSSLPTPPGGAPPVPLSSDVEAEVKTFDLEKGGGPPTHVRFAAGGRVLVLAELARVGWWEVADLLRWNKDTLPSPSHPYVPAGRVLSLLPQPGKESRHLLIQTSHKTTCHSVLSSSQHFLELPPCTALGWSVRGKQIVAACPANIKEKRPHPTIRTIDPANGAHKTGVDLTNEGPEGLEKDHEISSISYLENFLFLVVFSTKGGTDSHLFGLNTEGGKREWTDLPYDVCPAFNGVDGRMERRHIVHLRAWDPLKHVLLLSSGPSTEIGGVGMLQKEGEKLSNLVLPEDLRPVIPLSATKDVENVAPLALECDLTCIEEREFDVTRYGGDDGEVQAEEVGPMLLVYSSEGVLAAWRIRNRGEGKAFKTYPEMRRQLDEIGVAPSMRSRPSSLFTSGSNASQSTVSLPFGTPIPTPQTPSASSVKSFPFGLRSDSNLSSTSTLPFGSPASNSSSTSTPFGSNSTSTPTATPASSVLVGSKELTDKEAPKTPTTPSTSIPFDNLFHIHFEHIYNPIWIHPRQHNHPIWINR